LNKLLFVANMLKSASNDFTFVVYYNIDIIHLLNGIYPSGSCLSKHFMHDKRINESSLQQFKKYCVKTLWRCVLRCYNHDLQLWRIWVGNGMKMTHTFFTTWSLNMKEVWIWNRDFLKVGININMAYHLKILK
jgi:hypothetical protein